MKWEYLVIQWPHATGAEAALFEIQRLGNDGWELVAFHYDLAYFKRPVALQALEPAKESETGFAREFIEEWWAYFKDRKEVGK